MTAREWDSGSVVRNESACFEVGIRRHIGHSLAFTERCPRKGLLI